MQDLCCSPDSCCNHTSTTQPGASLSVPPSAAALPLLGHLHSVRVDWGAINPLCVHSKHETAGSSEPPVKSCIAEIQKMALGGQILEVHTGHYMEFLLQNAVKIPVLNGC